VSEASRGESLGYDAVIEALHEFVGRSVEVSLDIVTPEFSALAATIQGRLDSGHPQGSQPDGREEGVLFILDVGGSMASTTFAIWRDKSGEGRRSGNVVAWRRGPLIIQVHPTSEKRKH
jgi:hypothetical protein